jgi:hypothetical protein
MTMSTQKVKADSEPQEPQPRQRFRGSKGKIRSLAVGTIVLLVVGLILVTRAGQEAPRPSNESSTGTPAYSSAESVATRFLQAYGAFNEERAITYLAADTDISGLMEAVGAENVNGTLKELRLLTSFLEAQRYEQMLNSCDRTGSSSSGTAVRCTFDFHLFGSDETGLGPFHGSFFDLTVRDGEIVRASKHWGIKKFSPQVWEPFADWVSATYPRDAAVMYTDGAYDYARLSERSMRLWEQRIRDYVVVERAPTSDEAAPDLTAGRAVDADQKVVELTDRNIRDLTPGVPAPKAPYLIDLSTREMTRLPEAIIRSLGTGRFILSGNPDLAIDARDRCRFLANADGTDKRIITGWTASPSGAWSPDSTRIVAAGDPEPPFPIVVVDAMTGEVSKVADGPATAAIWLNEHTLLVDA